MDKIYDLIIIGGGCAGLSAGIYAGRARLDTLILEKSAPGGQVGNTAEVVNYPGIRRTDGPSLVTEMQKHAEDFGVEIRSAEIERVELGGEIKTLTSPDGVFKSRAVIIATGAAPRKAGFEGEAEFTGHGVAYCATCDGQFFSGLDIFVVGGGYSAAEEALYLTRFGKSVTMIVRGPALSCARSVAAKVTSHPKMRIRYNTEVVRVEGDTIARRVIFRDKKTGELSTYEAPEGRSFGLFVFVGYQPSTELFKGVVDMDKNNYILTDDAMRTNLPGVFAAGDLRPKLLRQIVTAVADGAIAATSAEKYVTEEKERLGLPMFEDEEAPQAVAEKPAAKPAEEAKVPAPDARSLLSSELRAQLGQIFTRLTKDLTLVTVIDPENEKSAELALFLEEIAALSPHIALEKKKKGEDEELEARLSIERFPVVALLDEKSRYTGVKFIGVPGGHEMNSFVLALLHVGSGDRLTDEQKAAVASLADGTSIQVCVSLSCHFCPEVVSAAHSIAIESGGRVSAEMIDVALFPDIRARYNIMSVPATLIRRAGEAESAEPVFGARTLDELLSLAAGK